MRIPLIFYSPGIVTNGVTKHITALYDLMPTFCELTGIETPDNDGISLLPLLKGKPEEQDKHAFLYWGGGSRSHQAQAVRLDDWFGMRENSSKPVQLWDLKGDVSCEKISQTNIRK